MTQFRAMLLVSLLMFGLVASAGAGVPDLSNSYATTRATEQVSITVSPDGGGTPLNACYGLGAGPVVDATIDLWVIDGMGDPIYLYPHEDMWLEAADGGMVLCPRGSSADGPTDITGHTTFSQAMFAGHCGIGIVVMINGSSLYQPAFDMLVNSPDINGDLQVNLSDVAFMAGVYGTSDYCADFYWDGTVGLADVVIMAQSYNSQCP